MLRRYDSLRHLVARSSVYPQAIRLTTVLLWLVATLTFATPAMALLSGTVDIAADVTGGASDCNGGSSGFSYDYTVTNFATAFPMLDFQIPLSNVNDVCNIVAPLGWSSSFSGTTLIFQASLGFELPPGGAQLPGFELDSPLPGVDEFFTADLINFQGNIISVPVDPLAPIRVPEPALWSLIAVGTMGVAFIRRQRRLAV
jgi:hypothetical protein